MAMTRKIVRFPEEQIRQLEAEAESRGIPVGTWMAVKLEDSFYVENAKQRLATLRSRC